MKQIKIKSSKPINFFICSNQCVELVSFWIS